MPELDTTRRASLCLLDEWVDSPRAAEICYLHERREDFRIQTAKIVNAGSEAIHALGELPEIDDSNLDLIDARVLQARRNLLRKLETLTKQLRQDTEKQLAIAS